MDEGGCTEVAVTGSPAQANPLSLPFCILYASQDRGMQERREQHETGGSGGLEAR
jgi:hypothetical protein